MRKSMDIDIKKVKIIVTVPVENTDEVRKAIYAMSGWLNI